MCPYSDCDEGGEYSAICACVDKSKYGLGEGEEWFCLHSTCKCEPVGEEATEGTSSASALFAGFSLVAVGAAVAMFN